LVYSRNNREHKEHLKQVFQLLSNHKLYAKMETCEFLTPQATFLGYVLLAKGIQVGQNKVDAI